MAKKTKRSSPKKAAPKASSETTVTRITASDSEAPAKKPAKSTKKPAAKKSTARPSKVAQTAEPVGKKRSNPLRAIAGYFVGSWQELMQVRWPDRRATWEMTGALIAFTGGFVLLILLLDALFQYLFGLVIK